VAQEVRERLRVESRDAAVELDSRCICGAITAIDPCPYCGGDR